MGVYVMNETTGITRDICSYCGWIHDGICPRIEEIEYYPDGAIKKISFKKYVPAVKWKGEYLIPFEVPLRRWCEKCGFCEHEVDNCPHKCCSISAHCGCFRETAPVREETGHICGIDCIVNTW